MRAVRHRGCPSSVENAPRPRRFCARTPPPTSKARATVVRSGDGSSVEMIKRAIGTAPTAQMPDANRDRVPRGGRGRSPRRGRAPRSTCIMQGAARGHPAPWTRSRRWGREKTGSIASRAVGGAFESDAARRSPQDDGAHGGRGSGDAGREFEFDLRRPDEALGLDSGPHQTTVANQAVRQALTPPES